VAVPESGLWNPLGPDLPENKPTPLRPHFSKRSRDASHSTSRSEEIRSELRKGGSNE